jgi:hypothetical protein
VTYRFCHRCQAELPAHDEGTLIFCTQCGAPQVVLSEELLAQVEAQAKAAEEGAVGPIMREPASMVWAGALRCIGLAAAIAAVLAGLSAVVPPVVLLTLLWAIISPVVVIGLFQSRFPLVPITTGFGARLGLLTGLAVGAVITVSNTIQLLVLRFGTHGRGMTDMDAMWNGIFAQEQTAFATAQFDAGVRFFQRVQAVPEFRAGFILASFAFGTAFLVVITTAGGAFAGFVRSRVRAGVS